MSMNVNVDAWRVDLDVHCGRVHCETSELLLTVHDTNEWTTVHAYESRVVHFTSLHFKPYISNQLSSAQPES